MRRITRFFKDIPLGYVATGFASAALLVLSFPSYSVWWLAFIGMIPFLLGLLYAREARQVVWMGATHSVSFILLGFTWISYVTTNFGGLPWIVGVLVLGIFSLFGEIQFFVFALVGWALLKRSGRAGTQAWVRLLFTMALVPMTYIGLDYLNPKIFPNTLGHVLYNWFPVAQTVEYVGLYGLTYPILLVNFSLTILIVQFLKKKPHGPAAHGLSGWRSAVVALVCVAVFFGWADRWGRRRIAGLEALEQSYTKKLKVSVIQGNIGDIDKITSERGYEPAIQLVLGTYRKLTLASIEKFHPDLVIWPETSYPFLYTHGLDAGANRSGAARDGWIKDFLAEIKTPLYFGSYSSVGGKDFNTAFLVKPPYELAGVYRKSILLAFGEYVPLGPLAPLVQSIVPSIANFGRGPGPITLNVKGVKLGPQICYEGIFPEHSRGAARIGSDVLLNITNDSWFGLTTEPWLHLALTIFRSIELRRPMIRSTNTGVSTIVDITGEMRYRTRLFEPASIDVELAFPGPGQTAPETFYSRHGEVLAGFCQALACVVLLWVFGPGLLEWSRSRKGRRAGKA